MEHYCYDFYGASGNLTNTMILEEFTGRLVWRLRGSSEAGQLSSVIDCMGAANPKMVGVSSVVLGRKRSLFATLNLVSCFSLPGLRKIVKCILVVFSFSA